jgi:transcriptional antiterminator RfaH
MDSSHAIHPVLDAEQQTDWYLAYTKPKSEDIGLQNLLNQGFEAWLPKIKAIASRRRAASAGVQDRLYTQEALFPRYLFFRPAHAQQSIASVRSTIGITKLVSFGFEPARLSHAKLMQIARWVEQQQTREAAELMGLAPGKAVQLVAGPLAGLNALVKMAAKDRVVVLLDILGKEQTVAVPYTDITPL